MTRQRIAIMVLRAGLALGVCIVALPIPACAQSRLSAQERAQLIQKLEIAKQQDEAIAADKTADPAEAEDARAQAYKADRRARDLEHGFDVSEAKIEDSLWVPPKALSTKQKAELIEKLKQTKALDERNAEYSAEENSRVSEDQYKEHEERVNRVLKDLEIGEDVPWSRIRKALEVPANP